MNLPAPPSSQQAVIITIISGPEKGARFQLLSDEISLGRDASNDIVLAKDLHCSRRQAVIRLTNQGAEIHDLSKDNPVIVNGKKITKSSRLDFGVPFTLGHTMMVMQPASNQLEPAEPGFAKTAVTQMPLSQVSVPSSLSSGATVATASRRRPRPVSSSSSPLNFFILLGGVGLVFAFLITYKPSSKEAKEELAQPTEQVQATLDASKKNLELERQIQSERGALSASFRDAQSAFMTCFRDFRVGQYARAYQACQAALALNPNHPLARKYLENSQLKLDQNVQEIMIQGRKALERNQFAQCSSLFQSVLFLLRNENDPRFKEAKQLYDECMIKTMGRY